MRDTERVSQVLQIPKDKVYIVVTISLKYRTKGETNLKIQSRLDGQLFLYLPKELTRELEWEKGDTLRLNSDGKTLSLTKIFGKE